MDGMSPTSSVQTLTEIIPQRSVASRYIRVQQALAWYPFKRAKLYEHLASGRIDSFVLREGGSRKGIRLIDRFSLDRFLELEAEKARGSEMH